jgi:hypothetical protein
MSGWRRVRTRPTCTSSFKTMARISSECPVRTATSTRGCRLANRFNTGGNTYVLTAGAAPSARRPALAAGLRDLFGLSI